jgi:DNA-binding transcriptional ArsR family regulator
MSGGKNKLELEEVFSSKSRMKILKLIYQLGQLNISDVARRIKMNYSATAEHLKILEAEGIVEVRVYGRVHMYRFSDSEKAKAVAALIEAWEKQ